tara:strand:- start:4883 stop:6010 length:1128 start_codon:yes stop_codon:yes gene_type:complete
MRKISDYILWASLFGVPFFHFWRGNSEEEPIRFAKIAIVIIIAGFCLGSLLWKKVSPGLGVGVGYVVLHTLWSGFGELQLSVLASVLASVMVGYAIASRVDGPKKMLSIIAITGYCQAIWGIVQHLGMDPFFVYIESHDINIPVGTFGQQTLLGPYLASAIIASLYLRGAYLLLIPLNLVVIFFVNSSFTFLALAAGVAFWVYQFLTKKQIIAVVAFFATAGAFLYLVRLDPLYNLYLDNGRFEMWRQIFDAIINHFSFYQQAVGFGGGSFINMFHKIQSDFLLRQAGKFYQAHNMWLQTAWEFGFIGVAIITYMKTEVVRAINTSSNVVMAWSAILLVLITNCVGNFPERLQPTGMLIITAYIIIMTNRKRLVE